MRSCCLTFRQTILTKYHPILDTDWCPVIKMTGTSQAFLKSFKIMHFIIIFFQSPRKMSVLRNQRYWATQMVSGADYECTDVDTKDMSSCVFLGSP